MNTDTKPGVSTRTGFGRALRWASCSHSPAARAAPAPGLDVIFQPKQFGPFRFGRSTEVRTGKRGEPAAFSITCLEADDDPSVEEVRNRSRDSLPDMLKMDSFIGATTASIGHRMVTVSAWSDPDAPRRVMREGHHAVAMKHFFDGRLA